MGVVAIRLGMHDRPRPELRDPGDGLQRRLLLLPRRARIFVRARQTQCGVGRGSDNGNCHFNSSAVTGMALQHHPPIECDAAIIRRPAGRANINTGKRQSNFSAASLEMNRDCAVYSSCQAAILTRPTSNSAHPRQVVCDSANGIPCAGGADNPALPNVIYKWAVDSMKRLRASPFFGQSSSQYRSCSLPRRKLVPRRRPRTTPRRSRASSSTRRICAPGRASRSA